MCFTVDLWNQLAIKRKMAPWAKTSLELLGEDPGVSWVSGFSHPSLVILDQDRALRRVTWGLIPSWADPEKALDLRSKTLNATCENFTRLPSFKPSAHRGRCVVPLWGFYEYQHQEDGTKRPYWIGREGEVLLAAGLWATCRGEETCSLITMPANTLMREIHNTKHRMPCLLTEDTWALWLSPADPLSEEIQSLFIPRDDLGLVARAVQSPGSPRKTKFSPEQGELF